MATSNTVPGFVPVDSPTYTTPVQVTGHIVHNLTVARTPAGQAVFGWTDSATNIFYCAVNPDFDDVYRNDVVPDGDERVVFDLTDEGWTVNLGSVWVDRGELFCAIKMQLFVSATVQVGFSKVFIADDVENPVVWTERAIIDSQSGNGGVFTVDSGGPPTVLESGRWVLPFPMWGPYAGDAFCDLSALSISDDRGLSWSVVYVHRRAPIFSGTTGPIADTIGQDPLTGYLYWSHYDGPGANEAFILESTDEGSTWTLIESNAPGVWNFGIDNGTTSLYAAFGNPGVEWEWWDAIDPGNPFASFVDLNLTVIPSSLTNTNFQNIVFLEHGSIAFIDERRIAGYFFPPAGCPIPDPLHIPYKDRLNKLELDADTHVPHPESYRLMADHDFDNLKEIERWAGRWMTHASSPDSCDLYIPHKNHLAHGNASSGRLDPATQRAIASMSFDNYKTIQRWAYRITGGECACAGPAKCILHIPFKDAAQAIRVSLDGSVDRAWLRIAGGQDFENYKTIERWANEYARGECTGGEGFPPGGFPDPPVASAQLLGQLFEVSTQPDASALLTGQLFEVAMTDAAAALVTGQVFEVSTQPDGDALLVGQLWEVAVKV